MMCFAQRVRCSTKMVSSCPVSVKSSWPSCHCFRATEAFFLQGPIHFPLLDLQTWHFQRNPPTCQQLTGPWMVCDPGKLARRKKSQVHALLANRLKSSRQASSSSRFIEHLFANFMGFELTDLAPTPAHDGPVLGIPYFRF